MMKHRILLSTVLLVLALGTVRHNSHKTLPAALEKLTREGARSSSVSSGQLIQRKQRSALNTAPMGHGGLFWSTSKNI